MLYFIIFTDISLSSQAFLLSRLWISAKILFLFQRPPKLVSIEIIRKCSPLTFWKI